MEKGKSELVEKTLERYEAQLVKASLRAEQAKTKGKDIKKVAEIITEATQKHLIVLEKILEKAPEQARLAIEQAMRVSTKEGLEKAVQELKQLKQKDASGYDLELIKAKCLEMEAPPGVCAKIEEALQSAEPLRTLCIESGGPPETCEKFPSKNFKSFKALKAWCIEMGGPSETCSLFESKCRELGVTSADACFRIMSISSVNVVGPPSSGAGIRSATAPALSEKERCLRDGGPPELCEKLPSPVLSEEEREQGRIQAENVVGGPGSIGVSIGIKNNQLIIVGFTENSPAERAGLRVGDRILIIDGKRATDVAVVDAVKKLSGEIGTDVSLIISRDDKEKNSNVFNISVNRIYIKESD
ncbi:PDZ domain-containing protein [Patescibacteria group bacterium]|nr:PDZ domain-containing protein [Patescibacteria group bacterium]